MSGKQTPRCEARLCQLNKVEEMIQETLTKQLLGLTYKDCSSQDWASLLLLPE